MRHINITDTCPIDNRLMLDKDIFLLNMAKSISEKISVKDSAAKTLVKPLLGDKTFGIEPAIRFYDIEDGDETEKVEESEILVFYDSSLAVSNQNLTKRHFPYIGMFDHEGPVVINEMRYLTVGVFEHLEVIFPTDVYKRLAYTKRSSSEDALRVG